MQVVVTGGAGYLGTMLVPLLVGHGHRVRVYDSRRQEISPFIMHRNFEPCSFEVVQGDIRDESGLAAACRDAEAIIHLAAIPGYPACARDPDEARSINVGGTEVVAKVAGRDRPVLFASTSSCYGAVDDALCTEETPLRPVSLYGETKVEAERIMAEQCNAVIYRIATAYGYSPQMRLDLLVNDLVHRALHEEKLLIYEGHFRRSFIHVEDVARGFLFALENYADLAGSAWNLGDEQQNLTKLELCGAIAELLPSVTIERCADGQDADRRDYAVSYARIRSKGYRTQVSLRDGIRELISALR